MNIAYVCADPGIGVFGSKGASVHVQEVLRVLVAHGHDIDVFCRRVDGEPPADLALAIEADRLRVHEGGRVSGRDAAHREELLLAADSELIRLIGEAHTARRFDAVYERYSLFSTAGVTAARAAMIPSILEVNAPLPIEQAAHRHLVRAGDADRVARIAIGGASVAVCVSEPVAAWARGIAPSARVVVEPNGVNPQRFAVPAHGSSGFTVGFVGTLKPWHGTETLVEAARILDLPGLSLTIVGDGPERDDLERKARAAGVATTFTGAVAPADVPALVNGFDVAVAPYPAHGDAYFSPLKVLEYMAAGVAVVASGVGQIPELVDDGRTGVLVPGSDPAALAAALGRLAGDPERRAMLGGAARADVMRRRTWEDVVGRSFSAAGVPLRAPEPAGAER